MSPLAACSVLFFSRPRSEGWPHHGRIFSHYLCPLLIDSFTGSPVHVLMLYIQAVHDLYRLRTPNIVPYIIYFSRQLPCFLMMWPRYVSFLALTVSNSSLFTPALLRTHSFSFFAVHESRGISLSPIISKASRHVSSFFLISSRP